MNKTIRHYWKHAWTPKTLVDLVVRIFLFWVLCFAFLVGANVLKLNDEISVDVALLAALSGLIVLTAGYSYFYANKRRIRKLEMK